MQTWPGWPFAEVYEYLCELEAAWLLSGFKYAYFFLLIVNGCIGYMLLYEVILPYFVKNDTTIYIDYWVPFSSFLLFGHVCSLICWKLDRKEIIWLYLLFFSTLISRIHFFFKNDPKKKKIFSVLLDNCFNLYSLITIACKHLNWWFRTICLLFCSYDREAVLIIV